MNMLKLPEKFENTKLAYITEGERKLLRRRDAVRGKKSPEYSKDGVPVLRSAAEIEAEGVAKEVAANKRRKDAGLVGSASDYETAANIRSKAAGFPGGAAAQEIDANRRSKLAGFTSAVDQEIDANRRARLAGFKNAALQENPAAAAPGESIYSTKPFVDPRTINNATKLPTQTLYNIPTPSTALSQKHGYKKQYTNMASAAKDYNKYVDMNPDLASAYKELVNNPNSKQAQYWKPRMANMSKEAFGKAHAGESMALQSGTYSGATKFMGSKARPVPNMVAATATTPTTPTTTTPTVTQPSDGGGGGGGELTEINVDAIQQQSPVLEEVTISGAESEVVQERIKNLINTNSPLFKAATTKALQSMNASGLVNSSMAQEAVMSSILAVAIPIAQADAQTFTAQKVANQNASNVFKTQQNAAYYEAFITKLNGEISKTLRQLAESAADWRAVLAHRARIAVTPGMSTDAAANAIKLITPTWFD